MINQLSGIYLCTNVDGIHVEEKLIGYIDQHPFIVLKEFVNKYYIYGYNKNTLYPAHMVGYINFLYIKNEGDSYDYTNFCKYKVKDIDQFESMYETQLKLATISTEYTEEYLDILDKCISNGNEDLQYVLDLKCGDFSNINKTDYRYLLSQYYEDFKTNKAQIYLASQLPKAPMYTEQEANDIFHEKDLKGE